MTDRPQIRDGESLDDYAARLDELLACTDGVSVETWIWAALERELIRQLAIAEDELLGDLARLRPVGLLRGFTDPQPGV